MSRYFVPKPNLYEQVEPSTLWTVQHTGGYPIIDVFVNNDANQLEKIIPFKIEYVSDTQCKIHFTQPFAGFAKIAG